MSPVARVNVGTASDLRNEELRRLEWFSNYLDTPVMDPVRMPDEDFAAIVAAAVDVYGVAPDRLCDRFAINKSTLSRWKSGKNAPQPFARELVVEWIKGEVRKRLR
jgi:hypothetical protein